MRSNEEFPMDEKTLASVLNENVSEIKEIKDYIKEQQQQIGQQNQVILEKDKQTAVLINSFENKYQKLEVNVAAPSTLPITKIASEGIVGIKAAVMQGLADAFAKNRVLVLPADGGKGFISIMAKRVMYLSAIAIIVCSCSWFGFHYWYMDSQNSRYRKAWYWNYLIADSTKKQKLQNQLDSLNVPAINSYRTDSIERYVEIQTTELRIRQLEREADSLRKIKGKP
ncbi:MAG: hypothetical protein ABIN91_21395 [Mucilaginibacter sp.]|uniref:hypothetical protein n=1 Tax=Mucilaginibacter sp. TaxID=1882438 RepID=UPI0032630FAB